MIFRAFYCIPTSLPPNHVCINASDSPFCSIQCMNNSQLKNKYNVCAVTLQVEAETECSTRLEYHE